MKKQKQHKDEIYSLAKITLPNFAGFLPRERLFQSIDAKRSRPVVWISGPAGSGKTTLAATYLQINKQPHLWYRVDEGDNDPATFFYYLGMAAKKITRGKPAPMPLLGPEYAYGVNIFALRFFEELFARFKDRAILVLDNYHHITEHSPIYEVIEKALTVIPEGINVFIISRHDIPKTMTELEVKGLISRLGWNDLRLTIEETTGIVNMRGQDIQPEAIQQIHMDADGWIAGLILMLEGLTSPVVRLPSGSLSREEIVDYIGNQVFDRLDIELQKFLLKTAFLPRITAKMARELTGVPDSNEILNRLVKEGYFTEKDASVEPVYHYHQLMREFLVNRALSEMTHMEIDDLLAKSAHLLEASGAVENAAEIYIKRCDWNNVIRIILMNAHTLLAQGRNSVLKSWFAALPPDSLNTLPWLIYWKAACTGPYDLKESLELFKKAFILFEDQNDVTGTLLAWSGAVDSILYAWEDFTPLALWLEWLEARLSDKLLFPSPDIEARVASSVAGIFGWGIPSHPHIIKWLNHALLLVSEIKDENLRLQAIANSFAYFFWNGDIGNMQPLVGQASATALSPSATPFSRIVWKITEMRSSLLFSGEHETCLKLAEEALELAANYGIYQQNFFICALAASAALSLNKIELAELFLKKMYAFVPFPSRGISNISLIIDGWCHFLRGNHRYALTLAQKSLKICLECATSLPEIVVRQLIAKIYFALGEKNNSLLEVAKIMETIARAGNPPILIYFTLLDKAKFLFDMDEEARAIEALTSAMRIGAEHNFKTIMLCWQPSLFADLCANALKYNIETTYVRGLIQSLRLVPEMPPYEIDQWPWAIEIYTLGQFKILCDKAPLEFQRKASKKPLDLLKTLLALGGRGVSIETITDTLWPESEGDAAHHSFEMNLKRLRDLLGHPETLKMLDGRLSLDDRVCRVDFWAFERFIMNMEDKHESKKAMDAAQKAVNIYAGHFLSTETGAFWSLSVREQLRAKYLSAVRWLGRRLEDSGKWQEAAECYEKGLDVDDLAEELYRRLMNCHMHLGHNSEAILTYMRCKKILSLVLGITPSEETTKLYQSIKSNK